MIYAVCTPTELEGPARIKKFLKEHKEFRLVNPKSPILEPFLEDFENAKVVRTWTNQYFNIDSFFAARLERI